MSFAPIWPSPVVSVTASSRFSSTILGAGVSGATVGSFVGSPSVAPVPSAVSVDSGDETVPPVGLVPLSDTSLTVTGLPLSSRKGAPVEVTPSPLVVAVFCT